MKEMHISGLIGFNHKIIATLGKEKKHLYFYSTGSHCLRKKSEPLFIVFMFPLGGKHTQLAEGLALSLSRSLYLKLYKQTAKAIHHNAHVSEKGMGCGENKSI